MATTTLKVKGMSCGHCVQTVQTALESVEGVEEARVDLREARAVVDFDDERTTPLDLARAVTDEGYPAEEATV
jgi:copper chaperone